MNPSDEPPPIPPHTDTVAKPAPSVAPQPRNNTIRSGAWIGGVLGAILVALAIRYGIPSYSSTIVVGDHYSGFTISGAPTVGLDYAVLTTRSGFNATNLTAQVLQGSHATGWSIVWSRQESVLPNDTLLRIGFAVLTRGTYKIVFLRGNTQLAGTTFSVGG